MRRRKLRKRITALLISLLLLSILLNFYFINKVINQRERIAELTKKQENALQTESNIEEEEAPNETDVTYEQSTSEAKEIPIISYEVNFEPVQKTDLEEPKTVNVVKGKEQIYGLIVNKAGAEQEFVDEIVRQVELIPQHTIDLFETEGWKICITNENLKTKITVANDDIFDDGTIIYGLTSIADNTIYLYNVEETKARRTIIHEYGHYTDKTNGWPSLSDEFKLFYPAQNELVGNTSIIDKEEELYAEAYKMVILNEADDSELFEFVRKTME